MRAHNGSNTTVSTDAADADAHSMFWWIVLVFLMVLFVTGVIANVLILVVVKRTPSMHSVTNVLLCNLAVSDLTTLLWPLAAVGVIHLMSAQKPLLGDFFCKFVPSIPRITFVSTVMTLSLIAMVRYRALVHTLLPTFLPTLKNMKYYILAVWTLGLVDAIPLFVFVKYDGSKRHCRYFSNESREVMKVLTTASNILILFLPLTVISYCYAKIVYGVYISKTILGGSSAGNEEVQMKRKLVRTSILVTVVGVVCYAPIGITTILYIQEVLSDEFFNNPITIVLYLLCFIKAIMNPFLYAFQSANYRAVVESLFRCCRP